MIKSQDILLICIIIIIIIVICHCKKNNKEGFVSNIIFSTDKLEEVNNKLGEEKDKIGEIKKDFDTIIKRNKIQYYIENEDDDGKKNGTYRLFDDNTDNIKDRIELGALIDINNLVKLNSDLGKKLENLPYNKYYEETVKGAVRKRINLLNEEIIKQKQQEQLEESKLNKFPIKNIKHIDTSVMFKLENVKDDIYKDIYKVKYINDNDNSDTVDTYNNSKKCNNKCLGFDSTRYSNADSDYYRFEDCEDNTISQQLKANNIKQEYKCYNNNTNQPDLRKLSLQECNDGLDTHLKYDEKSYVDTYNGLLKNNTALQIKNKLDILPDDFVVITPRIQPIDEPNQCLTVDNEGLSFQDCDLFEHQRFNYERDIV